MDAYIAELFGTGLLVLLGNGVVANVVLKQTKGHDSGWIVITTGWGLAVYTAVLCVEQQSGAHLNPAVTLGLAVAQKFSWVDVPGYMMAQLVGGFLGAALVFLLHKLHYDQTDDADAKLATFCTAANLRSVPLNLLCEVVATFVLVYSVLVMTGPSVTLDAQSPEVPIGLGSIGALRVGLVVFAIGLCLGGPTGYAINPARDLAPRIAHWLLPVPGKRDSDWGYAPIPVIGPLLGSCLAALAASV